MRKNFRWGDSVLAILWHFSAPEIRALLRHCRLLIRRFCNPAFEEEDRHQASIITFEMYEYGFTLAYDYEGEEWVLEVRAFPDWGSPYCRRRPPNPNKYRDRSIDDVLDSLRKPDLARIIRDFNAVLYETTQAVGALLTRCYAHVEARVRLHGVIEKMRGTRIAKAAPQREHHIIQFFNSLAHQSHEHRDLVQLVRAKVSGFFGSLSTYALPRNVTFELWDVGLFGALPEEASG